MMATWWLKHVVHFDAYMVINILCCADVPFCILIETVRLKHLCDNCFILPLLKGILASGVECISLRLLPCVASDYGGVSRGRRQFCPRNNVPSLEHRVSSSHCLWEIRQRKDMGLGREVCDCSKCLETELPRVRYRTQARNEIILLLNSSKNIAIFKIILIIKMNSCACY